jgi:hypothetical protein
MNGIESWYLASGGHDEGAVPPRAELADVRGVEQLVGAQQYPVAPLNTLSTRPASSFAFSAACVAASSSSTVPSIARIRCAHLVQSLIYNMIHMNIK